MEELNSTQWLLFRDSEGRILEEYSVRKIAFHKGIAAGIRGDVWPFLLGYYSFTSTSEERRGTDQEKCAHYNTLISTWKDPTFIPSSSFDNYTGVIEKDSLRTDRKLHFFSDENMENVFALERVLKTFLILHPNIGYVQGMSDILAPLMMVLPTEHQAFWCFNYIVRSMESVFSDLTLSEPLANLATLCQYIDKPLFDHLNALCEGEQWLFSFRWILLNFKRELHFEQVCRLWECFWSKHASEHFPLLFTVAVLFHFRDTLLQYHYSEDLIQFSQSLNGKIPLSDVLLLVQDLLRRLKSDELCPHDVKSLFSTEMSVPPSLIGFVRARQKFSTLHSNKIEIQRHQIWKSLFGDAPVQNITSPFTLSPVRSIATHSASGNHCQLLNYNDQSQTEKLEDRHEPSTASMSPTRGDSMHTHYNTSGNPPSSVTAPPIAGFVPRQTEIQFRDDIRRMQVRNDVYSYRILNTRPATQSSEFDCKEPPVVSGQKQIAEMFDHVQVLSNHHTMMKSPLPHNSSDTLYANRTHNHDYYSEHSINTITEQEQTESQSELSQSVHTCGTQSGHASNVKAPSLGICASTCSDGKWNFPNEASPAPDISYDDTQFDGLRSEPQLLTNLCY